MIEPTVGRVAWYWPDAYDMDRDGMVVSREADPQPLCAWVVFVHSARMVNLAVFDHNGVFFTRSSVTLLQDGDPIPSDGRYAEWMPDQKGQAAQHEALEQQK
jgi:hypothetical protein